jgi:uncharacterized protein YfkK (UPF0435 family)
MITTSETKIKRKPLSIKEQLNIVNKIVATPNQFFASFDTASEL